MGATRLLGCASTFDVVPEVIYENENLWDLFITNVTLVHIDGKSFIHVYDSHLTAWHTVDYSKSLGYPPRDTHHDPKQTT